MDDFIKARKNIWNPNDPILRQQCKSEAIFMMNYQVENYHVFSIPHVFRFLIMDLVRDLGKLLEN